jgi:acetyl-CoA acyltransferase
MHEAFAAQVLSNLQWLDSDTFARERLGRPKKVGILPEDRINVMGGSIAIGHPFGATGARLTITLLNEMKRRGAGPRASSPSARPGPWVRHGGGAETLRAGRPGGGPGHGPPGARPLIRAIL